MKTIFINDIIQMMLPHMNNAQCEALQEVLQHVLFQYDLVKHKDCCAEERDYLALFYRQNELKDVLKNHLNITNQQYKTIRNTWEIC